MQQTYKKSLENVRDIIIRQAKANATNRIMEYIPNYKERIYLNCLNNIFKDDLQEIVSLGEKNNITFFYEIDEELYSLANKVLIESSNIFYSRCQDLEKDIDNLNIKYNQLESKNRETKHERGTFEGKCNLLQAERERLISDNHSDFWIIQDLRKEVGELKSDNQKLEFQAQAEIQLNNLLRAEIYQQSGNDTKIKELNAEIRELKEQQNKESEPELIDKECFTCPAIIKANPNHDFVICDKCKSYWGLCAKK